MPPTFDQPPTSGKLPTSDHYQFEAAFRQTTSNMYDRIGKGAMHGNYGEDTKLAKEMFAPANPYDKENQDAMHAAYGDQKSEIRDAYLDLTRYDRYLGYDDPAVSLILLPPKALLQVDSRVREEFLKDYAGARVVDEARLVVGATSRWTLAVVQGDLRDGRTRPARRPSSLSYLRAITPEGYTGMGGSIDRQDARRERRCTKLEATVDGQQVTAYGLYIHGGAQSPGGAKIRIGGHDPVAEGDGKAQIIISEEQPYIKPPYLGHLRPMAVSERLMYWVGMNS